MTKFRPSAQENRRQNGFCNTIQPVVNPDSVRQPSSKTARFEIFYPHSLNHAKYRNVNPHPLPLSFAFKDSIFITSSIVSSVIEKMNKMYYSLNQLTFFNKYFLPTWATFFFLSIFLPISYARYESQCKGISQKRLVFQFRKCRKFL